MQYIIENNDFKVTVDSKGCEVVSVLKKSDDTEYIWCGDASAWKRHTPVLFPVVGRYKNDCTIYDGKEYHMTQDRKSTRLNSSHRLESRMPSSA